MATLFPGVRVDPSAGTTRSGAPPDRVVNEPQGTLARREAAAAYLFILPWILGFLVFTAGPMIAAVYFSFTDYNVLQPANWVGLDNYRQILTNDDLFRVALVNTLVYTAMYVPLHMAVALGLALLLNLNVRGIALWRTYFYLPSLTPVVAAGILWRWILNPTDGVVNQALSVFGVAGPGWTTDPNWMKPSVVLMTGTWAVGGTMLIYLAGLKNVPRSLYEAAMTDGASAVARFFHITLPMISGVLFFTAVIGTISALQTFAQSVVLFDKEGGSANAALFYVMYLFNQAFRYFHMGYASALAWILFLVIVIFTILQFRLSSRWIYYEGAG